MACEWANWRLGPQWLNNPIMCKGGGGVEARISGLTFWGYLRRHSGKKKTLALILKEKKLSIFSSQKRVTHVTLKKLFYLFFFNTRVTLHSRLVM